MKIERVILRSLYLPLVAPFETSFGVQETRDVILVTLHDADGIAGWGECTAGEDPFYSAETTQTSWHILADYLIPALLTGVISADPFAYHDSSAHVRGNNMARATLEAALFDIEAQRRGVPMYQLFGGTRTTLHTGVSVGIQPSIGELVERVGGYLSQGYRRIKIKIKHGWDVEPVAALRKAYADVPLMVDANCAFSLADLDMFRELDQYGLMMIEQPFHYEDLVDHAELQRQISTPICLDESAHSLSALRAAIALGSGKIVNIKQGRVGGPTQAKIFNDVCREAGIPVWAGGMLETGIGRALNIALATLDNFSLPGDISASKRYWHEDIIEPEVTVSPGGEIAVSQKPGRGYDLRPDVIERATTQLVQFKA